MTNSENLEKILKLTHKNQDCCIWNRCYNSDGYPRMLWKGNANGKVHRIVKELQGELIKGLVVRHTCDNIKCINPDHLVVGTPTENMQDRKERGRTHNHVSEIDVKKVKELLDTKEYTLVQIAQVLGMKVSRVKWIKNRKVG